MSTKTGSKPIVVSQKPQNRPGFGDIDTVTQRKQIIRSYVGSPRVNATIEPNFPNNNNDSRIATVNTNTDGIAMGDDLLHDYSSPMTDDNNDNDEKSDLLIGQQSHSFLGPLPEFLRQTPNNNNNNDNNNNNSNNKSNNKGGSNMKRNQSDPALSKMQKMKLEQGVHVTSKQLPKSFSHSAFSLARDPVVTQLIDIPYFATLGVGSNLKEHIEHALKMKIAEKELRQKEKEKEKREKEKDRQKLKQLQQQKQQHIPPAPMTIPPDNAIINNNLGMADLTHSAYSTVGGAIQSVYEAPLLSKESDDGMGDMEDDNIDIDKYELEKEEEIENLTYLKNQGWNSYLFYVAMHGIVGPFLYGYNITALNVPRTNIANHLKYTNNESVIDEMNTYFVLGQLIGSLFGGYLADKIGRKKTLLFVDLIYIIAGLILFFFCDENEISFAVGRCLCGIAGGVALTTVPPYLSEISPHVIRGAVGTLNQIMITVGILVVAIVGYPSVLGKSNWKYILLFNAIPSALQIVLSFTFPESPKWLLQNGKEEDARKALQKLRMCDNVDIDIELIKAVLSQNENEGAINPSVNYSEKRSNKSNKSKGKENKDVIIDAQLNDYQLMHTKRQENRAFYWALAICVMLMLIQQFSGINTVFFYSANLLKKAGLSHAREQWFGTMGICLANISGVLMAVVLIERLGRIKLLLLSAFFMIIFSGVISLCMLEQSKSDYFGYGAIGGMALYSVVFELGLGPIPWLMTAEVSPSSKLGTVATVANIVNAGSNMSISQFGNDVVKYGKYFPFIVVLAVGIVCVYLFIPETKGKTETQIQTTLQSRKICGY